MYTLEVQLSLLLMKSLNKTKSPILFSICILLDFHILCIEFLSRRMSICLLFHKWFISRKHAYIKHYFSYFCSKT